MNRCTRCPFGAKVHDNEAVCTADNRVIHFLDQMFTCSMGLWSGAGYRFDQETNTIWLPRANEALEKMLDAKFGARVGTLRWQISQQSALGKVASFVSAVTSGEAAPEVIALRQKSCSACPALVKDAEGMYCGACGCGKWQLARLNGEVLPKLKWVRLDCPLKRPGFSNSS